MTSSSRTVLFLDVDGVLLGHPNRSSSSYQLANHATPFLRFVLDRYTAVWATTHCRQGNADHVVSYVLEHTPDSLRDEVRELLSDIAPSSFRTCKTELFPQFDERAWIWIDDSPLAYELEALDANGWRDRLLLVNTCRDPDDLLRAMKLL